MDWDEDGKKDLLTGENNGRIRIYLNVNTDADPVFSGYSYLQQGSGTFDAGSYSVPWVTDWNNDGKKDVICGESGGKVWLLINTGTNAQPAFATKSYIPDGTGNLDPGGVVSPCVFDFNGDGKKDLMIGETYGNLFYYENKGTDAAPLFNGYMNVFIGATKFDTGYYARPAVGDWDGDGIVDLLVGSSDGYVYWVHGRGPLSVSDNAISAATGGALDLGISAGTANGNRGYLVFAGVSGTNPGTPLPGGQATLPINWDVFTNVALQLVNTPMFKDFTGILAANGRGKATLDLSFPLPPAAVGMVMHFAMAVSDPFDYVTNATGVEITP